MGTFTAKDFVDFVNDEFDVETLQLMQNVLNDRLTLLNKMKDMANPRTVVQGYKLNKQDLKEMRGFTMQELRMKAIEILQMIGVTQNEKNIRYSGWNYCENQEIQRWCCIYRGQGIARAFRGYR